MRRLGLNLVICTALLGAVAAGATDLALWTFEVSAPTSAGPHAAEGGVNAGAGSPVLGWHADANVVYSNPVGNGSVESFSSNYWTANDYYEFSTSTLGYDSIAITWHQTRSGTGPGTFDLAWSTDGTNFTVLLDDYTVDAVTWSSTTPQAGSVFGPVAGPSALNNQPVVYFRLISQVTAATGGSNRVDNILITGNPLGQTGACCVGTTCVPNQTVAQCAAQSGTFMGAGTSCTPNPCAASGACCVGEVCLILTAADCVAQAGTYQGDGTTCTPDPCIQCIDIPTAKSLANGTNVVLCDVVISSVIDLIQGTSASMYVQEADSSAGYCLFSSNPDDIAAILAEASLGDTIRLWGTTGSYNGLQELLPPFQAEYIATVGAPAPLLITAAQFAADPEYYESMLVEIECATFRDGGGAFNHHAYYIADDATGAITIYISSNDLGLTGVTIPDYPLNIRGIVLQNSSGYSIQLRSVDDLVDNPVCLATGACCYGEVCVEEAPQDCTGVFQGAGTTCTPYNPCVPPFGACCVTGICYDVIDQTVCASLGGCWQGDYSVCADKPCNPPAEAGDLALGLSDADARVTLRHVRDYDADGFGEPVGNWAAFPYVQSVEFDNLGGVQHNAHGNLLGLNFGVALGSPPQAGQGGALYNFATDGSNCGEELYSFQVGSGTIEANVTNLSVSNDNQYVAVWGQTSGSVHVLEYNAGTTPGTGGGATVGPQYWSHLPGGALTGKGQGTTWYTETIGGQPVRVLLLATVDNLTAGTVKLNKVEFRPGGSPIFTETNLQVLPFANDGLTVSATDVEYNPAVSPYIFVVVSFFTTPNGKTFLAIVDPAAGWAPVVFNETSAPFLDVTAASETGREIALGPDGYLYWSMYSTGSTPHVARIDVSGTIPLAQLSVNDVQVYHYADVYSAYNGMDIAHDGAPTSGACCINDGCHMTNQAACLAGGGLWNGAGSACWPNDPCVPCLAIMDAKALPAGSQVKFCNLVVSSTEDLINSGNSKSFYAQHPDNTGGVEIYGSNADIDALLTLAGVGDEITIQGKTDFYSGKFELSAYAAPILLTNHGQIGVSPIVIPATYLVDYAPEAEVYESQLVTVECVEFSPQPGELFAFGNYSATTVDGQTTITVRIARGDLPLVGVAIPEGPVNITGIVGQFASSPWTTGYQLQPRFPTDIVANPNCGTAICRGDANCDGVISWRDIDFFVAAMNDNVAAWQAMFAPGTPSCDFANNDVNADGTVSWRDIDPLVAVMNTVCP